MMTRFILCIGWLFLTACSGDTPVVEGDTPAAVNGQVVILTSRDEKFMHGLWEQVKAAHPQIELVVDYGKDAGYLDRMRVERDNPRADLYLSKASGPLESAVADDLLQPLPTSLLEKVPERFRGTDGRWVGLSARARVLVRRKGLETKVERLQDLTDPALKGRVARTVATNSSFVGGVASYLAQHGEAETRSWLAGLQENSAGNVHPKHTPAVAAVAEGLADVALVNHYYFYRNVLGKSVSATATEDEIAEKLKNAPIEVIYPASKGSGVAWNVSGAGLLKGAPHAPAALAVLEILLSMEGQKAYAFTNREYPVVAGVASPPGVHAADSFTWSDAALPQLAAHQSQAVALIQELGLE
jgi:iron(III) transport system substrate-binding protein